MLRADMIDSLAKHAFANKDTGDPMTVFNDWLKQSNGSVDSADEAAYYMRLLSFFSVIKTNDKLVREVLGDTDQNIM